jgi:hypothetical protein
MSNVGAGFIPARALINRRLEVISVDNRLQIGHTLGSEL